MYFWKSRRIQFLFGITLTFFVFFALLRAIFYFGFSEVGDTITTPTGVVLETLSIGLRFDLRLAVLLILPVFVVTLLPHYNIVHFKPVRTLAFVYLSIVMPLVLAIYIIDFGHYAYLGNRIDTSVLRFLDDAAISAGMLWQSYPVIWVTAAWLGMSVLFIAVMRIIVRHTLEKPASGLAGWQNFLWLLVMFALMVAAYFGRYSLVPLRWNHAYFSGNSTVAALGLNPVLYFIDTYHGGHERYDIEKVARHYDRVADYLSIPLEQRSSYNFDRRIGVQDHRVVADGERKPNVIFVMLESLGASRLGIFGNPLEPTPNLDEIGRNGWFFPNFYVPVSGTSRTVFASLTGMPDVSTVKTATRNPLIAEQRVILNAFENYKKFYFTGGSAGWANMSALINRSINDMTIYQEGSYDAPIVDVWGISDLDLFKAASKMLGQVPADQPFFAYIQTAANHRPFTIPENNESFETIDVDTSKLHEAGFRNLPQFNAVRLLDYNIGRLLELAKEDGYFDNTIFVFFGDHNNRITQTPFLPPYFEKLDLDGLHVPYMIYAPKYFRPAVHTEVASLLDVVPTIAGLIGLEYENTTFGRDYFIPAPESDKAVYVQTGSKHRPIAGVITERYLARITFSSNRGKLHDLHSDTPEKDIKDKYPEIYEELSNLSRGIYETTRFQFYNNRPQGASLPVSEPGSGNAE